ncbi:MAG: hypothetical protein ACR2IK_16450, partial [Chloroflexota bacterium]
PSLNPDNRPGMSRSGRRISEGYAWANLPPTLQQLLLVGLGGPGFAATLGLFGATFAPGSFIRHG